MQTVTLNKMIDKLGLVNLVQEVETEGIEINSAEINRPALQLAGYFEHFACERVQIIGYVEYTYLNSLDTEVKMKNYELFMSSRIPCVIYASRTEPDEAMIELAKKYKKPQPIRAAADNQYRMRQKNQCRLFPSARQDV